MSDNPFVMRQAASTAVVASSGRWLTDPRHMGVIAMQDDRLGLKTATTTATTSDQTAFFTALALRGAQASISAADTYVTLCDVIGAGFLCNVVTPTYPGAHISTVRITRDGTQYVLAPGASQTSFYRMVLGPLTNYLSIANPTTTTATAGDIIGANTAADPGFNGSRSSGIPQAPTAALFGLLTPEAIMNYGLPALRFETGCKVEVKCSLLSGTAVEKQAGVTWVSQL